MQRRPSRFASGSPSRLPARSIAPRRAVGSGGDRRSFRPAHRAAFTLIELLVVIAVIVLVVSLLLVAIAAARSAASRAGDVSTLRQLAAAHAAYANDHTQRLLPGYVNADLQASLPIKTDLADGTVVAPAAAATYVWRLAPYVDRNWQTFHRNADPGTRARLDAQYAAGDLTEIALQPSYALNSIFIGGDSDHGGGDATARSPWNTQGNPTIAATRVTDLRNPTQLVLFAPVTLAGNGGNGTNASNTAWHELRAPYLKVQQWSFGAGGTVTAAAAAATPEGIPSVGKGAAILPVAFCDGSATGVRLEELAEDMRRWAPFADGPKWRVP
ncbi:MAG: hypothetical protein U0575_11585 [Phycisphaerales bacterium]